MSAPSADFSLILSQAIANDECLAVVLSKPRRDAPSQWQRVRVRPIELDGDRSYQFAQDAVRGETHVNLATAEAAERIDSLLDTDFLRADLFTPQADFRVFVDRQGQRTLKRLPPTKTASTAGHDRTKQRIIPEGVPCPFLIEAGVMSPNGQVKAARRAKFRQINRFLEIVDDVAGQLPDGPLGVVDYGCGKSYLTFAVHHLLTEVHRREVSIVGLDREPSVVETCRIIAGKLQLKGIEFECGDIASHQPRKTVDLAISLHACDTATDDALAQAVRWQAKAILAVPCCQHELAGQASFDSLGAIERHGILKERMAALATDALRAEMLELCGYRTQVLEFIDTEHTPKNLMIRAVRRERPLAPEALRVRGESFERLKRLLGLDATRLERSLSR